MESVENNTEYNKPCYKKIIVTLGTFQTVMNLFGAIGIIMENTGLSNALETIYKENSLLHVLKGKAVSRVLSAHFIIDPCLSTLMGKKIYHYSRRYYTEIRVRQFVFKFKKRRNKH